MRSQISSLFCSSSLLKSLGGGLGMKMIDDYDGGGEFFAWCSDKGAIITRSRSEETEHDPEETLAR